MIHHFLFVRHGETDANAAGILQGHLPTHLNAVGRKQAELLADRLRSHDPPIARILCSDLPRALESAEPLGTALGLAIDVDASWRERSYGALEGVDPARREALRRTLGEDGLGGEAIPDFERRIGQAVRTTLARLPSGEARPPAIVVVTHGGVIRRVLRMLHEGKLPSRGPLPELAPVLNASIFHLVWDGEAFSCVAFNDDRHLGNARPSAMDVD
jgi:probable phosphoglycerate mutase